MGPNLYYVSGNGYITTATLREILAALDDKLGPEDLDGIIAEIDTDGSGTVDFDGRSPVSRSGTSNFSSIGKSLNKGEKEVTLEERRGGVAGTL